MQTRTRLILLLVALHLWAVPTFAQLPAQLDSIIKAYTDVAEFNGSVLIAQKGKILLEKGYGLADQKAGTLNTPATIYGIASITKTFTSSMILKLAEQKRLAISDKISKYFPHYKTGDSINIGHLLSHTSGISDRAVEEKFRDYDFKGKSLQEKLMVELESTPLATKPGANFSYSNRGYYLLGYLIEKLTGTSYEQAIASQIFKPYHLDHSGFDFAALPQNQRAKGYWAEKGKDYVLETPLNDPKVTYSAGAIYSNVGDLYRWHQVLQHQKYISQKSEELAFTNHSPTYGYGFQIDSLDDKKKIAHSGGFWGFRTYFAMIPADDICVILLANHEVTGLSEITRNLLLAIYGKPFKLPAKRVPVTISREILQSYTGNYEIATPALKLEVKLEGKGLIVYPFQGPASELAAIDQTHFYILSQESAEIDFEEEKGQKQMRVKINGKEMVAVKK